MYEIHTFSNSKEINGRTEDYCKLCGKCIGWNELT